MSYPKLGERVVKAVEKCLCAVKRIRLVYRDVDVMPSYYKSASGFKALASHCHYYSNIDTQHSGLSQSDGIAKYDSQWNTREVNSDRKSDMMASLL